MNVVRTRARQQGFSLVEAIIAIGVLTVAMTAMLGVLPGGMNQARQASGQGRALAWLETIAADLRLARSAGREVSPWFDGADDFHRALFAAWLGLHRPRRPQVGGFRLDG